MIERTVVIVGVLIAISFAERLRVEPHACWGTADLVAMADAHDRRALEAGQDLIESEKQ